jgi:hypothetical protein
LFVSIAIFVYFFVSTTYFAIDASYTELGVLFMKT